MPVIRAVFATLFVATSLAILAVQASADQTPDADDIITPPGLFPEPADIPVRSLDVLEQPDKYDIAADVLWGSILGNKKKDMTLVRALDGISVLVSGVTVIDGKEQLYLGIDKKTFAKYDINNLYKVLEARFPDIPIYIEESEGFKLLSDTGTREDTVVDIFSDNFNNLTAWTATKGTWNTGTFTHPVPGEGAGNRVAFVRPEDCFWNSICTSTTKPMDLSGYSSATLSFHRWLDDAFSSKDNFVVEIGNDGVYHTVGSWDGDDGDGVWHHNTITLDEQHLGEETTVRIKATFCLFFCGDENKERVVAVDNVLIQGIETPEPEVPVEEPEEPVDTQDQDLPNLVAHISVSPDSANSGTSVKVQYSVKNTGTARSGRESITVYRHLSETDNPETGGWQISTFTMRSPLAPGAEFSQVTDAETPSVSEDTLVYYYACVSVAEGEVQTDDNCDDPVTVTVKAKTTETPEPEVPAEEPEETPVETPVETPTKETPIETPAEDPADAVSQIVVTPTDDYTEESYPKPPYESCYDSPERKHVMAGDVALPRPLTGKILGTTGVYSCGTITLGGVEKKDGTRGFVMSSHVITGGSDYPIDRFINTNVLIGHGEYMKTYDMGRLLGKVFKRAEIRDEGNLKVLVADAAFVAYPQPKTTRCSLTWENNGKMFCLDLGDNQIERTVPLKIRGKGKEVYTVVGSQEPTEGLSLQLTGAVSGVIETDRMTTDRKMLFGFPSDDGIHVQSYDYIAPVRSSHSVVGDSGSPIYTIPDSNNNVQIVGVHRSFGMIGNKYHFSFSPWYDVADAFDLKPISQ